MSHHVSFEVENIGDIKTVDSGWMDDDIEEVMVVSSKKEKKRRPLSVIVEALDAYPRHSLKRKPEATISVDANHFEYMQNLPAGENCEAILARKFNDDEVYTVKLVRKAGVERAAEIARARIRNEQKALRMLNARHTPYVSTLWWSFEDERAMYLVVDRTDGRNLRNIVEATGVLSGPEALLCSAELVVGLSELHDAGIIHTNLEPEDILIGRDGHVLVTNFEAASIPGCEAPHAPNLDSTRRMMHCAPERLLGWDYDRAVDWWSFGLILFWLLRGSHPFIDESDIHPSVVHSKILYAKTIDQHFGMDEIAHRLVARCLQRNPALRIDGLGVQMHEFFHGIDWDDVSKKRIQAPFRPMDPGNCPPTEVDSNDPVQRMSLHDADEQYGPFSFDWLQDILPSVPQRTGKLARIHTSLQDLRTSRQPELLADTTIMPAEPSPLVLVDEPLPSGSRLVLPNTGMRAADDKQTTGIGLEDANLSVLPDLVPTPHIGLPTPPNSRVGIGNLRKYSSLNFDELDSMDSGSPPVATDSFGKLARSKASLPLRKSKSILGLSLESVKDVAKEPEDTYSTGTGRSWTSKLRKRGRSETPLHPASTPTPPPPPVPELPKGVEHMGQGIGYVYRGETRRHALNLASLTPRTCHGIFTGRRSKSRTDGRRKVKEDASSSSERGASSGEGDGAGGSGSTQGHEYGHQLQVEGENEEDIMDEVMREIYGDDWNAGMSPDTGTVARRGLDAGLGWGPMMTMSRFGMAEDASFAGGDCTLRLVTSPSTPRLDRDP